jgi:2'-5' RNA ligase superfamily
MWAHVTLIYPFRDSSLLNNATARGVTDVLSGFASFPFRLTAARYFRSPQVVLYLGPEPAAPFANLIQASRTRLPTLRRTGAPSRTSSRICRSPTSRTRVS